MAPHSASPKPFLPPPLRLILVLLLSLPLCAAQDEKDPAKTARALLDSVPQLIKDNHLDEAIQKLHEAYEIAFDAKDGNLVAEICLYLGVADLISGNEEEAQKAYESAVFLLERAGENDQIVAQLQAGIALSHNKNRHSSELKLMQTLAGTYARLSKLKAQADTLTELLNAYDKTTEMPAFCNTLEQLLPLYQKLDDRTGLAGGWYAKGKCSESSGDSSGAIADYKKSIDAFRALGDKSSLAAVLDTAAGALRAHGRAAEALPLQTESASLRKDLNVPRDYAQSLNDLALVDQDLGHFPEAVIAIEQCVNITRTVNDPDALATSLTNEAAIYRDVGRIDEAFKAIDESLQISRDACLTDDAKKAMKVMGTIHMAMGDPVKAAAAEAVADDTTDICANKNKGEIPAHTVEPFYGPARMLPAALVGRRGDSRLIAAFQSPSWIITDDQTPAQAAQALLESAAQMLEQKKIDQAIESLNKALPLATKSGDDRLLAAAYIWLGNAQLQNRNEQEGQKAIDSGVALLLRAEDSDDIVHAFQMAIDLGRENHLPGTQARYLRSLAAIDRDSRRLDDSLKALNDALQVASDACLTSEALSDLKEMAAVHAAMGEAEKAADDEARAHDTTDICAEKQTTSSQPEDKEPAYMTTHNMSIAMAGMGMAPKAIANFQAELKKAEAGQDPAAIASAREGLAYAYSEFSQYPLAESNLLEAERIQRELGNPRAIARTQTSLATVYTSMGRYYDALNLYDQIERSATSLQDIQLQINTLLTTADIYRHLKSYDQAFDDAEHALKLSLTTGFRNLTYQAQQIMALVQLGRHNYDEAESLIRQSATNDASNSIIHEGMVEVYLGTRRYADAEKELAHVTADNLAHADSAYRLQYYTQRGIARLGLGRLSDAIDDFNLAIRESEQMRFQFLGLKSTGFLDAGSFGGRVRPYRGMVEALALLALSGLPAKTTIGELNTDAATAAFHFAELARGRSLGEKLASSHLDELRKQVPASVLQEEQQISDRLTHLARHHNETHPDSPATPEEAAEFAKFQADARSYLQAIERDYPLYARAFQPGIIPVEDLPIGKDEALLEYAIGVHNTYVFVIAQDHKVHCHELPISVEQMEAKVRAFRNLIAAKRFSPALAHDLYASLLGSLPPGELPRHLILVPDGPLALLPFEALNTAETGDPAFLSAGHSITYAQSAAVLTWTRKFNRAPAEKPLFALADPIFAPSDPRFVASAPAPQEALSDTTSQDDPPLPAPQPPAPAGYTFRRLPETQTEVQALASILGVEPRPPDVLVGPSAAKATLQRTDIGAYRYLHFATHAAALGQPGRVNEPFLVLNQVGNPPGDDGLLTMSEIMDLKLNSELVVLGACDTGVGDVLEGDGVASLASAFQFAGAESVVLSLWELPSEATLPFMRAFYQDLKQGRSKVEALRSGRDAMRRLYPDPYYWAVFALYSGAAP